MASTSWLQTTYENMTEIDHFQLSGNTCTSLSKYHADENTLLPLEMIVETQISESVEEGEAMGSISAQSTRSYRKTHEFFNSNDMTEHWHENDRVLTSQMHLQFHVRDSLHQLRPRATSLQLFA